MMKGKKTDYGTLVTNAGKAIESYGKELGKISAASRKENVTEDELISYVKKRHNFIHSRAKRDLSNYMKKRDSSVGYMPEFSERKDAIGAKVEKSFDLIIRQCEEIAQLDSSQIEDYTEIIERYDNANSLTV